MKNTCVVYKLNCKNCPSTYIGETKRTLLQRVNEHKKDVLKNIDTVVATHCHSNRHEIDWQNVNILDRVGNWSSRILSEMLHIHLEASPLNKKEDTNTLSKLYVYVLDNLKYLV